AILGRTQLPGREDFMWYGAVSGARMVGLASSHNDGDAGDALPLRGAGSKSLRSSAAELPGYRGDPRPHPVQGVSNDGRPDRSDQGTTPPALRGHRPPTT